VRISLGTAQHATQASVDPYMIVLPGNSKNFDQRFYEYMFQHNRAAGASHSCSRKYGLLRPTAVIPDPEHRSLAAAAASQHRATALGIPSLSELLLLCQRRQQQLFPLSLAGCVANHTLLRVRRRVSGGDSSRSPGAPARTTFPPVSALLRRRSTRECEPTTANPALIVALAGGVR
jgi:hypothetical protein